MFVCMSKMWAVSGTITLTVPRAAVTLSLPSLPVSVVEKECFPSRLLRTFQVLANVSSTWPVSTSSQSFDLEVEKDMKLIGRNLRDETGVDKDVAFFERDPRMSQPQQRE
jgi:hypothetical protein